MLIFKHYNNNKTDFDLYNFKKIFENMKIKIFNNLEKSNLIRFLIYFLSLNLLANFYYVFSCELNFNKKLKLNYYFYDLEFPDFCSFLKLSY